MRIYLTILLCIFFITISTSQDLVLGQGQNERVVVTTSSNAQNTSGANTTDSQGFLPNLNSASRFLSQATFGPNFEAIESIASIGFENWIEAQFEEPRQGTLIDGVVNYKNQKNTAEGTPNEGAYNYYWDFSFFQYHMSSNDLLRQRVALALSEFFVISQFSSFGDNAYALATYYDMLMDGAFGNYRDLLGDVTFHPAMGEYLTFMNNPKSDTLYDLIWEVWPPDTLSVQYIFPDENYAREVMQLFSIGLCELNIDGTCKKDQNNMDIPTYDNTDIAEFAKIFTGFSYGDNMAFGYGANHWEETFLQPMQIYDEYHEPGVKRLLNGSTVPNRIPVDGIADVNDALDNLFNHPNVGPFFGKFMIQRLVTSNPSPDYVARVAQAFNGSSPYGSTRGDMKAVIKAILLDEEARSCQAGSNDNYGMLREPFVRYMQLGKAFDLYTPNGAHRNALFNVYFYTQQKPFASPSVFNFFQSDYQPIGRIEEEGKVAPEFQITNTQTISGYLNALNSWLMEGDYSDVWGIHNMDNSLEQYYPRFDFTDEIAFTEDAKLPQLIERLNLILAHGKLSQRSIDAIINAIKEFEIYDVDCNQECTYDCNEDYNYCMSMCPEGDSSCVTVCNQRLAQCPTNIQNCINNCEEDKVNDKLFRVRLAIYLVMASPEYLINR
jgi:uncharacterized protein (DUF1800 family)